MTKIIPTGIHDAAGVDSHGVGRADAGAYHKNWQQRSSMEDRCFHTIEWRADISPVASGTWDFRFLKWPSTDTQFVLLEGRNGRGGTSISSPMETEQFILRDGNYKVFEALFSPWFWYDFAADLCCFWTNSCVSNFFHQLQRSENPSFELLSMSKLRVLSIDEKFPANPKTSFRRILEEYEAICSKYRFEVHL